MENFKLTIFLASVVMVSCQNLRCYDCDPKNEYESCADPVANNARDTSCTENIDALNENGVCVSAYLKFTGGEANLTGIYRGCEHVGSEIKDVCDWFKEVKGGKNITIVSCYSCNQTKCNNIKFTKDGKGSANSISYSFLLYLNVIFFSIYF